MTAHHFHEKHWIGAFDAGGGGDPPSTPSIAIVDNEDGTATVTISGSDAGTSNTVYTADWASDAWESAGSRVGDGDVAVDPGTSVFWAYVVSSDGSQQVVSDLAHGTATDGTTSVLYRSLVAVRDVIRGLALSGVGSAQIVWQKQPWDRNSVHPGIFCCPEPETIQHRTNVRSDVGYGVLVVMVRASNRNLIDAFDTFTLWREQISRALRAKPLTGVSEVYHVTIEPKAVILPEAFRNQFDVGALVVRCHSREVNTVT